MVTATLSIGQALADTPTDRLGRARLLPAQVEIAIASGSLTVARTSAAELRQIADTFGSAVLRAAASCADGAVQLSGGDARTAVQCLRLGNQLWRDAEAPYDAARARFILAQALARLGDREGCALELDAAGAAFDGLGARRDAESARQFARELGR